MNQCYQKKRTTINPIIDWEDEDVWEFLNDVVKVPHCSLYDEGFTRLGCVGCPLQGREGMLRDFERWPQYKNLYIKAFEKMIANHPGEIKVATGELAEANGGGYSGIHRLAPLVHLTENQSLTSGDPNQMEQAPKALPHTGEHLPALDQSRMRRNQDGGMKYETIKTCPNDSLINTMEENNLKSGSIAHHGINGDGEAPRERDGANASQLVDVDAPESARLVRTESNQIPASNWAYRYGRAPEIAGTMLDYWLWLCRSDLRDVSEPKPVPLIQTPK